MPSGRPLAALAVDGMVIGFRLSGFRDSLRRPLHYPKSRRKPSRKLFRNEFSNKNSVKLTDFFVDFNSVRMI